jgi:hypothetical protein
MMFHQILSKHGVSFSFIHDVYQFCGCLLTVSGTHATSYPGSQSSLYLAIMRLVFCSNTDPT